MIPLSFDALSDRGGPFLPAAKQLLDALGCADLSAGQEGIAQLARWIDDFACEEIAKGIDEGTFVDGAGALLGLLLIERYDRARYEQDQGAHLVRLNHNAFFNPFFAVDEAIDAEDAFATLASHIRAAELESRRDSHQPKPLHWDTIVASILPRLVERTFIEQLPTGVKLTTVPLIGDVTMCFQIPEGQRRRYVHARQCEQWPIDDATLAAQAIANLSNLDRSLKCSRTTHQSAQLILLRSGDGLDASRILLMDLHARLALTIQRPIMVGIPHRDLLVAADGSEPDQTQALQHFVSDQFRRAPHGITEQLFRVNATGSKDFSYPPKHLKFVESNGSNTAMHTRV